MGEMNYFINLSSTIFQRECVGESFRTFECMNKYFCPQLKQHFVKSGVFLIIGSVILIILSNLFFRKLYKHIKISNDYPLLNKWLKSLDDKAVRWEWMFRVRDLINDVMIFYIILVIYLNI